MRSVLFALGMLWIGLTGRQAAALDFTTAIQEFYVYLDDTFQQSHEIASGDVSLALLSEPLRVPRGACGIAFLGVSAVSALAEDEAELELGLTDAQREQIRVVLPGCELPGEGTPIELPADAKVVHLWDVDCYHWLGEDGETLASGVCAPCAALQESLSVPIRRAQRTLDSALQFLEAGLAPSSDLRIARQGPLSVPVQALSSELRSAARQRRTLPRHLFTPALDQLESATQLASAEAVGQVTECEDRLSRGDLDLALASCLRAAARLQEIDRAVQLATTLLSGPGTLAGRAGHIIRPR